MQQAVISRLGAYSFPSLIGLLLAGILIDFVMTPGSVLIDIPEVAFPLGILLGFLLLAFFLKFSSKTNQLEKRIGTFGWLGAIIGGMIGLWLASRQLLSGMLFVSVYDNLLTVMSIGIVAGTAIGTSTSSLHQNTSQLDDKRDHVLAESTWTKRPEPNPIVGEIAVMIAELEGIDPLELEPLATHVNPDVFTEIRNSGNKPWQILFYTDKYQVRVSSQGTVTILDIDQPRKGVGLAHSSLFGQ